MRIKRDNRGSAMIIIIVVIAFVSILVSTLYTMVGLNMQMKRVDREAKNNFYSAEGALEQINLGLQEEMSVVAKNAYTAVMEDYGSTSSKSVRKYRFNNRLLSDLKAKLEDGGPVGQYSLDKLKNYLTADVESNTTLSVNGGSVYLVPDPDAPDPLVSTDYVALVLTGLQVSYVNPDDGFVSVIETDIRISAPDLNFIQPSDMPDVFQYTLIANKKLESASGAVHVDISDNVYAGSEGLELKVGDQWNIQNADRVVVKGDTNLGSSSSLKIGTGTELWTSKLNLESAVLDAEGKTYVADDLIMKGSGSKVILGGEYYGYGNGTKLKNDGTDGTEAGGPSSAILINGVQSDLDMTKLERLLLSGSAELNTGNVSYDQQTLQDVSVPTDPTYDEKMQNGSLPSGIYTLRSKYNNLLWCSDNNNVVVRTAAGNVGTWEQFQLINNSDGTVALKDTGNHYQYVSVQADGSLKAGANTIGPAEKFWLKFINEDGGQYALLSDYNNKYVTVGNGTAGNRIAYASRDKVSGAAQLFTFNLVGNAPVAKDPVITVTYVNEETAYLTIGAQEWADNEKLATATITYVVEGNEQNITRDMSASQFSSNVMCCTITGLKNDVRVSYSINYSVGEYNYTVSNSYVHKAGMGNAGSTNGKLRLATGYYTIYCPGAQGDQGGYWCNEGNNGAGTPTHVNRNADGVGNGNLAWERTVIQSNANGSFYFYSTLVGDGAYGQITSKQVNGTNITSALFMDKEVIDSDGNMNFEIEYSGKDDFYYIKIADTDRYLYVDEANGWAVRATEEGKYSDESRQLFRFRWESYFADDEAASKQADSSVVVSSNMNTSPSYSMSYSGEDRAVARIQAASSAAYTVTAARITYSVNGGAATTADMSVSNGVGLLTLNNLYINDVITYTINFTGSDNVTRNTARSEYVHETQSTSAFSIQASNVNVNLGESIEVKSNQIAYLVPAECIGVEDGKTVFGQNPMSMEQYALFTNYKGEGHPNFKEVDLTKKITGLNKSLSDYHPIGNGYQEVFVQVQGGTSMVYFYVNLEPAYISSYFSEYYYANQAKLESYMKQYVNTMKTSNSFSRLTLDGNMVHSNSAGKIDIKAAGNNGTALNATQLADLASEELTYQKNYSALGSKLTYDYEKLKSTPTVFNTDLFDNLVNASAFAGVGTNGTVYTNTYGAETIRAIVVNNESSTAFKYNKIGTDQQNVCLILATGDVQVEADFEGIIIAKGKIQIKPGVNTIGTSREKVRKILQTKISEADDAKTIVAHYFINGDSYMQEESEAVNNRKGYAEYAQYITYENWSKK